MKQKCANGCLVIEYSFVDFDSAERDGIAPFAQRIENRLELLAVAHAGPAAVHSHFEQYIQPHSAMREVGSKLIDLFGRVDQAVKLKLGIAQQRGDDGHILLADKLIGHDARGERRARRQLVFDAP